MQTRPNSRESPLPKVRCRLDLQRPHETSSDETIEKTAREMMKVSVRPVAPNDAIALYGIAPEVAASVRVLVATGSGWASRILVDDVLAGVVALTQDGELTLYLEPPFQRKSIGTTVLSSTIQKARAAGLPRVHAKARVGSGGAALARKVGLLQVREDSEEVFFEMRF